MKFIAPIVLVFLSLPIPAHAQDFPGRVVSERCDGTCLRAERSFEKAHAETTNSMYSLGITVYKWDVPLHFPDGVTLKLQAEEGAVYTQAEKILVADHGVVTIDFNSGELVVKRVQ